MRKERWKVEGIVVIFAWMSAEEKHLKNYVDIYSSLGWNSLVCHAQFLNLFFPDKAASLAREIVNELVQELKIRPCPIIFASFSGGPKACMYKVLQIIEGKCEEQINLDEYRLIRDSVSGHIFDSCPVDFVSDIGSRFVLHQAGLKVSRPPLVASWITNGISSSLDALFLSRFESQRAEYWQTLYSTVSIGAPYLILCSEDDELAPFQIICNFASRLKNLGADVNLVKWNKSSHVGHLRHHPEEYSAAVTELLRKAAITYSQRIQKLEGEKMGMEGAHNEISDPFRDLRKAAAKSRHSLHKIDLDLNDYFHVPSSVEYHEDRDVGSVQDESNGRYIPLSSPPKINAHGVLGQFLFDVCVPKNVEDWDLRYSPSMRSAVVASGRRCSPFNPIKCIRRSRL
ncbi:peptidase [Perilla frutescens var. frutescens]|nr:peptidase [Perilla frutescens var. frutescens]